MATLATPPQAVPAPYYEGGLWSWLTTTDHKKIGMMYLITTVFFFIVGGLMALMIRAQLAQPEADLIDQDLYNQVFTMHGTTMIFLFVIPVGAGFGNYLVPLMIGARDMAYPRINALSLWLIPLAGALMYSAFLFGGAADTWIVMLRFDARDPALFVDIQEYRNVDSSLNQRFFGRERDDRVHEVGCVERLRRRVQPCAFDHAQGYAQIARHHIAEWAKFMAPCAVRR